jgi:two-component system response regulator MprA
MSGTAATNSLFVIDDDDEVRSAVARALRLEGFSVTTANGGAEALRRLRTACNGTPRPRDAVSADAIILDVLMPDVDGIAVCAKLRERGDHTPILLLTARDGVEDRVAGLDAGADDYLVKPFVLAELLARVRALLRRTAYDRRTRGGDTELSCGDLRLDIDTRLAHRGERDIELTRTEFALLELLMRNKGRVVTREIILDRIWGYDGAGSNTLEVFVSCLRRKMESSGEPRLLHTMRGFGYLLRDST